MYTAMLTSTNADLVLLFDTLQGIFWPKFWDSPPYAFLAHEALKLEHLSENDPRSVRAAVQVHGWRQHGLAGVHARDGGVWDNFCA